MIENSEIVFEALASFRRRLEARFGVRLLRLTLFGSQARGIVHEESDVDVLVLIREIAWPETRAVTDIAFDVEQEFDFRLVLSPLVMTETAFERLRCQERLIAAEILRDGIAI